MRFACWSPSLLAGLAIAALCPGQEPARPAVNRPFAAAEVPPAQFRGSGSCSATACHGSIKRFDSNDSSVRRNEHTTWMSSDPHSRAFQVLFDKRSEDIESNLSKSARSSTKAFEDTRCLVCHTTSSPAAELTATTCLNADGVGCESCHGASEKWLGPHTTASWKAKDAREKEKWGLRDTKTLSNRAAICAGCHVGEHSADGRSVRDVNHDLIAAGHPRLNFEFSAFLDNMPDHWDEKGGNAGNVGPSHRAADFPARALAIGRLSTIKAALALLGSRLPDVNALPQPLKALSPWPEFSEYGCFSCHHDLRDQAWRRGPRPGGGRVGSLRWGTWILPGTEELVGELADGADRLALFKALGDIATGMDKPTMPERIAGAAIAAIGPLEKCLASVAAKPLSAQTIEKLIDRINSKPWDQITSWDEAAQRYLALVPLYQSWLALTQNASPKQLALRRRLDDLLAHLKFPDSLDSPRSFEPAALKSRER